VPVPRLLCEPFWFSRFPIRVIVPELFRVPCAMEEKEKPQKRITIRKIPLNLAYCVFLIKPVFSINKKKQIFR
jgi:hypothetical protein